MYIQYQNLLGKKMPFLKQITVENRQTNFLIFNKHIE